jgi:hypothetical protein
MKRASDDYDNDYDKSLDRLHREPQRDWLLVQQIAWRSPKHGERVFWFLGLRPYTRRDGTNCLIAHWQGDCVVCGAKFKVTTPQGVRRAEQSSYFKLMTCPTHRGQVKPNRANYSADSPPAC